MERAYKVFTSNSYSLHKISSSDNLSFSKIEYSKFKFGDAAIAEIFGKELAKNFIKDVLTNYYNGEQLIVVSSPYSFIPTATFYMKNYFNYEVNKWLVYNNYPVVQETKIHRSTSYSEDYGQLNSIERMNLIGNDIFYIDKKFIENKIILFLDDVRITGSHETMIKKMLNRLEIPNKYFLLYFAELVNDAIPPSIENELNYAFVKSVWDIDKILSENNLAINTRVVKFILNCEHQMFIQFIEKQDENFKKLIFNMALGNAYHNIELYKPNLSYLQKRII
jgi:hypothetical protein